jgi:putative iron-only hydrogenase system regulator
MYNNHELLTLSEQLRERCRHRVLPQGLPWGYFLLPHRLGAAIFIWEVSQMETRVAVMSIIVENQESVEKLNGILHEYGEFIIGRMGIPYRKRKISIISIALDAPQNTISSLAGKMGSLPGVSVKTAFSSIIATE